MASRYNSQTKNLEEVKAQILLDQMKFKQKENEYLKLIDHLNGQLQRQPVKKTKGKPTKGGLVVIRDAKLERLWIHRPLLFIEPIFVRHLTCTVQLLNFPFREISLVY